MRTIGVDPARQIAQEATKTGVLTLPEFFSANLAQEIRKEYGPARIVAANNVFAHADNLADIIVGVNTLLAEDGVFVFEVSYLVDIVNNFLFDTVYHEHVSYHSITPLVRFFERLGMQLFDVERIPTKGGSIRGFAQRLQGRSRQVKPIVFELMDLEKAEGFIAPGVFRDFAKAIDLRKDALNGYLDHALAQGKLVAGYGASVTVTTLLWHFALTRKISFLLDDNPRKRGLYSPGCHIPVMPSAEIYIKRPDHVVILAWQYSNPIIAKHQKFLEEGGSFVIPLPELRIVEKQTASL